MFRISGSGIPALQTPVGFFPLNITYNATNSNPGPVQQGNLSSVPPTLAPGPRNEYGGSFRFGGNREKPSYIKLPNNNLLDTVYAISLSAWVFPESSNGEIISYWKNSHLGVSLSLEENHVVFDLYSREDPKRLETLKSPSKLSLARWYHVGVTYNNVTDVARIWIDGRVVMSGYVTGAGGYEFLLRTQYDAWIGFLFKGRISQVGFWDVALTNENICSVQNYWQIHQGELCDDQRFPVYLQARPKVHQCFEGRLTLSLPRVLQKVHSSSSILLFSSALHKNVCL